MEGKLLPSTFMLALYGTLGRQPCLHRGAETQSTDVWVLPLLSMPFPITHPDTGETTTEWVWGPTGLTVRQT